MMPRLTELIRKPGAIVVGGIIWGLWHAPLTIAGHNFDVDYPYVGILMMCVYCIAMNAYLTLLTEKTHSIYPASIAHMINNNVGMMAFASVFANEEVGVKLPDMVTGFQGMLVLLLPILVLGGVSTIISRKQRKRQIPE